MRDMPWEFFLQSVLVEEYHAAALICGHDFRFGARGEGTAARLLEACAKLGIGCAVVPEYRLEGITVSSTYIRSFWKPATWTGPAGFWGIPTSSPAPWYRGPIWAGPGAFPPPIWSSPPELLLPQGRLCLPGTHPEGTYLAVTNIGTRPTVNGHGLTIEPWLLDYTGDLYGQPVTLELWHFLRGERRFPSLEALQDEIRRNAGQTRAFFEK